MAMMINTVIHHETRYDRSVEAAGTGIMNKKLQGKRRCSTSSV